jgi:hypothetical protein
MSRARRARALARAHAGVQASICKGAKNMHLRVECAKGCLALRRGQTDIIPAFFFIFN